MRRWKQWWSDQQGAVSIYLLLILVPLFVACGLLIDIVRWKSAERETENAVKAGVRSTLSAYSSPLQVYGLYGLAQDSARQTELFKRTVDGNLSGGSDGAGQFRLIDMKLEEGTARLTPMYSLANHEVMKGQILEEMKYRAPISYGLEILDKFKKNGLSQQVGGASRFAEKAGKVEKLLEDRDEQMAEAWDDFTALKEKAANLHPFYQTNLRDMNELSGRIGIHTVEEVRSTLQTAQNQLKSLRETIRGIDMSIVSLAQAGAGAAHAIAGLIESRNALQKQADTAAQIVSEYEGLLRDLLRYAELLALLKLKSETDYNALSSLKTSFQESIKKVKKTNDELNEELGRMTGSGMDAEAVFASIKLIDRQELDELDSGVAGAVSLFASVRAQIQDGLLFTSQKYEQTTKALDGFLQQTQQLYAKYNPLQTERKQTRSAINKEKGEQRKKVQPVLDQVRQGLGSCSLVSGVDPFEAMYNKLLGDPAIAGSQGFYQSYLQHNNKAASAQPVPEVDLKGADAAGLSAMKLFSVLGDLALEVRDEFYIDEFAVSKFSYRTLGLEKDVSGVVKNSKELSRPDSHPLTNQEVEYLLYGSHSCAGNYSMAYAEMFALRLAIGTTEALLKPSKSVLAAGSPMLVLLAAVAEGAVQAMQDMTKLIQGDQIPLSRSFGSMLTMGYKDHLRLFLLLHSRESVLMSRMQALLQLNTDTDLSTVPTYIAGTATSSFRLWFMPGVMRTIGNSVFAGCEGSGSRCLMTRTAHLNY
ncbi:hypothetical protein PAESOLCIP111_04960 [Paenibacillus solanacearum]|uniref:Uncharacterized protein n=1 Tax=Paenibacillus solanacearum TaxID=2048548 RepID=A0A916NKI9_9BACL|nr:hypothetical protein [Paenibacillus solanacearum]CAG7645484.1 hypothetical protein PAESOLCIP111_04960 [Paenibacillus solanacearum]